MGSKHTVAMFVQGPDGQRVQVGWASPRDASGVRTFEYSPGFEGTHPRDVSFEDDDRTQEVAEEQHEARLEDGSDGEEFEVEVDSNEDEPHENPVWGYVPDPVDASPEEEKAAEPIDAAPNAELADDPTDASHDEPVELNSGGDIVEVSDEDEEEAEKALTRRDFREN